MIEATKPHKIDDLINELEKDIKNITPTKNISNPQELFERLKKELYDRDIEIYKCFSNVKFISFRDKVLTWESCVDEDCKKLLRKYWGSVIKLIIDDIFGIGTKVVPKQCEDVKKTEEKPQIQPSKPISQNMQEKVINKTREIFGDEIEEINIYKSEKVV
jgi:DNA polymerase-3 subunit gamma/tau